MTYKVKNISDIFIFYCSVIFCIISTWFGVKNVSWKSFFEISIFVAPWQCVKVAAILKLVYLVNRCFICLYFIVFLILYTKISWFGVTNPIMEWLFKIANFVAPWREISLCPEMSEIASFRRSFCAWSMNPLRSIINLINFPKNQLAQIK